MGAMLRGPLRIPTFLAGAALLFLLLQFLGGGRERVVSTFAAGGEGAPRGRTGQQQQKAASGDDWDRTDKVLVVAAKREHNTSWIAEDLPDWKRAIYIVDDTTAPLHTLQNKGNEANVYLTFIIDNYDDLPEITIFMHHHKFAFHNDKLFQHLNPVAVQLLKLDYVRKQGYQNLNCGWEFNCQNDFVTSKTWGRLDDRMKAAWPKILPNDPVPEAIRTPGCCAQFAVSKETIRRRSKQEYKVMHDWLMETEMSTYYSGRIFEYIWHAIFGLDPFTCMQKDHCLCDAFGICDIDAWATEQDVILEPKNATEYMKAIEKSNAMAKAYSQ